MVIVRAQLLVGVGLALGVAVLGACELHDRDGSDDPVPDAMPDTPFECLRNAHCTVQCDPLQPRGLQGCSPGLKCTWIVIQDDPEAVGKIGCVPDGMRELGENCASGPPGETTGFDDCVGGNVCVGGRCQDICGFGGAPDEACAQGSVCTRVANLFANGEDDPQLGVCAPGCDPVTQLRSDGTSCGPGQGCYLLVSQTTSVAVCAAAGDLAHGEVITGPAFANSCLPGHQPRRVNGDDLTVECGALCSPADVFVTDPANADDGPLPAPRPPAEVTNAEAEGGVAPRDCATRGAVPIGSPGGESCRYWWAREPFDGISAFSNTVGWCFAHERFRYDADADMMPDHPFPRCAALSSTDRVPPFGGTAADDATFFWCKARPAMFKTSMQHVRSALREPALDRIAPAHGRVVDRRP